MAKNIKVGGLDQQIQYEGIIVLCFSCSRVGHKVESCPYKVGVLEKVGRPKETGKDQSSQGQGLPKEEAFGPYILVA